jgi:hypothetical protein
MLADTPAVAYKHPRAMFFTLSSLQILKSIFSRLPEPAMPPIEARRSFYETASKAEFIAKHLVRAEVSA